MYAAPAPSRVDGGTWNSAPSASGRYRTLSLASMSPLLLKSCRIRARCAVASNITCTVTLRWIASCCAPITTFCRSRMFASIRYPQYVKRVTANPAMIPRRAITMRISISVNAGRRRRARILRT